ncbi:tyrosine-type recombinase/integrase [Methylophaga sp. UBA1464]|uniref:tyrosine-type recombinase/integrase n=2 Tax=unclassified Methylophaga TaxID=2629249 RepID=UPI0025EFA0C6|nr:tyrosine-type recombinase/integrase [Methylophaga sp. UBA1464]
MDNAAVINDWLRWLSMSKGRADQTINKYRGYLVDFIAALDGRDLSSVTLEQLEDYTGRQLFERKLSVRSRTVVVAAVRNFYAWAKRVGHISSNPADSLEYPTFGRRLPRPISLSDAEKLLMAPDLDSFIGIRDAAMMSLLIGCGMRVSGLCSLNQSSLIWAKDHKGLQRLFIRTIEKGKKERLIPAPAECMLLIRAYLGHTELDSIDRHLSDGDQVLFVSTRNYLVKRHEYIGEKRRIAARSVNDMLAKYADKAGVDPRVAHPHAFRHLYGTEAIESDVNILTLKALLGHERADTTEIYTRLAMRKLTEDVDRANPLGKMRTPVTDLVKHLNS